LLAEAVIQAKDKYGITAAVFGDDQLAINTMSGLINRGIKVPQDIGITGMDGEPWLQHLQVPLETVAFPVEKAIKRIEGILFEKKKTGCINLEMESMQGKTIAPCKS
jgi:DNA-binding LacI/PurR family transcriptional regulator